MQLIAYQEGLGDCKTCFFGSNTYGESQNASTCVRSTDRSQPAQKDAGGKKVNFEFCTQMVFLYTNGVQKVSKSALV